MDWTAAESPVVIGVVGSRGGGAQSQARRVGSWCRRRCSSRHFGGPKDGPEPLAARDAKGASESRFERGQNWARSARSRKWIWERT